MCSPRYWFSKTPSMEVYSPVDLVDGFLNVRQRAGFSEQVIRYQYIPGPCPVSDLRFAYFGNSRCLSALCSLCKGIYVFFEITSRTKTVPTTSVHAQAMFDNKLPSEAMVSLDESAGRKAIRMGRAKTPDTNRNGVSHQIQSDSNCRFLPCFKPVETDSPIGGGIIA